MAILKDREKLKDAFHYVIARAGRHPGFGATQLYKVLWFSEARTFVLTGEPIFDVDLFGRNSGRFPWMPCAFGRN